MGTSTFVRWLIGAACALSVAQASAGATVTFGGASFPACTLSGSTYTCSTLPLVNYDDGIVIASGYTVNVNSAVSFGYNNSLTMSGTATLKVTGNLNVGDIAPTNIHVSGGSFQSTGAFSYGAQQQNMTVNVTAASMNLGTGSAGSITGTLTSSGAIAVGSNMTVNGPLSGTTITTNSPVTINGNITASNAFTLASGSTVTGNITAPTVTLQPSSATVTGNITASNALTVGSGNTVRGNVTTGTLTMESSGGVINGNATVTSAILGYQTTVTNNIYCTAGNAANCGCVSDSSGYPSNSANAPSCSAPPSNTTAPHHILVTHGGSGVTCAPQTVTITACANAACTAPHYTGNASVTLTPGGAAFGTGSTGVNSSATLRRTTSGTVTVGATSIPAATATPATTCVNTSGASACSSTWYDAGFLFNVPDHIAGVGQTVNVSAVRTDNSTLACTPAFAVDKTVAFSCAYSNPSTGTLGMNVSPTSTALSALACAANQSANVTLKFDATGVAPLSLSYADVGELTLRASYKGAANSTEANLDMSGSSTFIAAPKDFAVAVPALATAPVDATSGAFVKAGQGFTATVTARNSAGVATPNFGKESTPETATMSSTLLAPGGGNNPALTDAAGAFTGGVSTRTLSWGEVGIIKLVATLGSTGYLGTANKTTGTSANVGRFTPAYFGTAIGSGVAQACPTGLTCATPANKFVYSGQAFPVTVTAYNSAGGVTSNYASSATAASAYARTVTLTAWDAPGSTATANPPATPSGSAMSTNTSGSATFVAGVGTITPTYTFPAKFPAVANLAPPTNIYVRATDSDGINSDRDAASTEMGVMVVGGRLAIRHSYGSELLALSELVTAQYWDGTRYATSTTDNLSSFAPANVLLSNCLKNLNNGGTSCKPAVGLAAGQGSVVLGTGFGNFRLKAPGSGNNGTVDVTINAPAWLPSTTGRVTYGIYGSRLLYFQEVH